MLLVELFDKAVNYRWISKRNNNWTNVIIWVGEFIIDNNRYEIHLSLDEFSIVYLGFFLLDDNDKSFDSQGITGTGNEFKVFSTVIAMTKEFIKNHQNIEKIMFLAKNTELSRIKLYDKFCKTFGKNKCKKEQDDGFINYEIGI